MDVLRGLADGGPIGGQRRRVYDVDLVGGLHATHHGPVLAWRPSGQVVGAVASQRVRGSDLRSAKSPPFLINTAR